MASRLAKISCRTATTNYKFPSRYSAYLKKWEQEFNQKNRFTDSQDVDIKTDLSSFTNIEISKWLASGKKLPRSLIPDSGMYLKNLFEEEMIESILEAIAKLRKNAELDFYSKDDQKFVLKVDLPARKATKAKGFANVSMFINYPHKFNYPENKILALAETPEIVTALKVRGIESYTLDDQYVRAVMNSDKVDFNMILADSVYQKPLNRDPKYQEKFGSHFPRKQNKMMSDSFPTVNEWLDYVLDLKNNTMEATVTSNFCEILIGDGHLTDSQIEANMVEILTILKTRMRDVTNFELSCCEDSFKFKQDMDLIEIPDWENTQQRKDLKKVKKAKA